MRSGVSISVPAADRRRLETIVADRNSAQKHVWCSRIVLLTADDYEPVWAIGSGRTPSDAQIAAVHRFLRDALEARFGNDGSSFRLLYGGSVKPANAAQIFAIPDVDGALVGGASLKAADFGAIVMALDS